MNKPCMYFDSCCFIDMVTYDVKAQTNGKNDEIWYYKKLIQASKDEQIQIYTSYLTIVECLYIKSKDDKKLYSDEIRRLFTSIILSGQSGILTISPDPLIIERSRDLLWVHDIQLKPFDSLHIASALELGCSEFITTDKSSIDKKLNNNIEKLKKLGIDVISVNETRLLPKEYRQTHIEEQTT